jgi:hypothetical protein
MPPRACQRRGLQISPYAAHPRRRRRAGLSAGEARRSPSTAQAASKAQQMTKQIPLKMSSRRVLSGRAIVDTRASRAIQALGSTTAAGRRGRTSARRCAPLTVRLPRWRSDRPSMVKLPTLFHNVSGDSLNEPGKKVAPEIGGVSWPRLAGWTQSGIRILLGRSSTLTPQFRTFA